MEDRIGFCDIARKVRQALDTVPVVEKPTLEDILEADRLARESVFGK